MADDKGKSGFYEGKCDKCGARMFKRGKDRVATCHRSHVKKNEESK